MKIRTGFVSNSSSSSFLIERKYITDEQWDLIINRKEKFRDVFMKFAIRVLDNPDIIEEDHELTKDNVYEFYQMVSDFRRCLEEGKTEDDFFKKDVAYYDNWDIVEKNNNDKNLHKECFREDDPEDTILFRTIIANFDMEMYLQMIGVDITKIFRKGE